MEKPSKPRRQPTQTLPTYDVTSGNRTWATLVGGECSLTTASTLLLRNVLTVGVSRTYGNPWDSSQSMAPGGSSKG